MGETAGASFPSGKIGVMRGIQYAQNAYGSPLRSLSPYFLRFWASQNRFSTFGDSTGLHTPHFGDFTPQNPKPSDFWRDLLPRLESAWFWGFPDLALRLSTELSTTFRALWTTCGQLWISSAQLRFSLFLQDFFFFPKSRADSRAMDAAPSKTPSSRRSSSNMASISCRKAIAS